MNFSQHLPQGHVKIDLGEKFSVLLGRQVKKIIKWNSWMLNPSLVHKMRGYLANSQRDISVLTKMVKSTTDHHCLQSEAVSQLENDKLQCFVSNSTTLPVWRTLLMPLDLKLLAMLKACSATNVQSSGMNGMVKRVRRRCVCESQGERARHL